MTLEALYTELERRDITLQVDGGRLFALDPHHRLSPALDEAIRDHRDTLRSGLVPTSSALVPLQNRISDATIFSDLGLIIDAVDEAFNQGNLTQGEVESLATSATERSRELLLEEEDARQPKMPSDGGFFGPDLPTTTGPPLKPTNVA